MDLLWIVDAQKDFIDPDGKLTVDAPIRVRIIMKNVLSWAKKNKFAIGYSQDWHEMSDEELSESPNFKQTFPEHCIAGTQGAELIPEISTTAILNDFFCIKKTVFNVWDENHGGGKELKDFVEKNNPENIYVMGVATDVCVKFAVLGFLENYKDKNVYVIEDAVWGLSIDSSNNAIMEMKDKGAKLVKYEDLE